MMDALLKLPHVQVILSDDEKTICSVKLAIERTERVDSGSMMFHMPRYIMAGQTVVFTKKEIIGDQSGALFFNVASAEEAVAIIENIKTYIYSDKDLPEDSILIEQKS